MISGMVEGWIRKFCGKFIRNFDQNNVEVTLTGTIRLHKIELRVEEFDNFHLPYTPLYAYINKLSFDLPVLLSSQFDVVVKDVLFIVGKGTDTSELDAYTAQKTLQIILGVLYLNLTSTLRAMDANASGGISAVELEYGFKTSDRLSLQIENVHFRIEEDHSCHFPFKKDTRSSSIDSDGRGDVFERLTVLGLIIKRGALHPPTNKELKEDSVVGEQSVWTDDQYESHDEGVSVKKMLHVEGISMYCGKEYSAIPVKYDERIRIQKLNKSATSMKNVDESVVLGGDGSDVGDDCASDASTDDGNEADETFVAKEQSTDCKEEIVGENNEDKEVDYEGKGEESGDEEIDQYSFARTADGAPTPQYLAFLSRKRSSEDSMVDNFSFIARMSVVYQTRMQVFGPLRLHVKLGGASLSINDAQATYLTKILLFAKDYVYSLQRKSMLGCLTCSGSGLRTIDAEGKKSVDTSRRARLRWGLIRNSVYKDWHKYAAKLKEGTLRWRAWFKQWRLCARYVALRELLIFHVGFEGENGPGPTAFKLYETLLMDHHARGSTTDSLASSSLSKRSRAPYRGPGAIAEGVMRVAETLVKAKMTEGGAGKGQSDAPETRTKPEAAMNTSSSVEGDEEKGEEEGISLEEICAPGSAAALMLSSRTVRALYSMQLELDSLLPLDSVVFCRYWADERFRRTREKGLARDAALAGDQSQLEEEGGGSAEAHPRLHGGTKAVLLVGVLDAVNLTAGSLGMSRLEASCVLRAHRFSKQAHEDVKGGGEGVVEDTLISSTAMHTKVSAARVNESTGTALCAWGQVFELELDEEKTPISLCDVEVECTCRGVFSPAYGNLVSPLSGILGPGVYANHVDSVLRKALQEEASLKPGASAEYLAGQQAPRFQSALHTVHANLDNNRTPVHNGGTPLKVRDSSKRADPSSMQNVGASEVSVRLLSQVVVGTATVIAEMKNKLKHAGATAISERKEMVARTQAMAGRSSMDDQSDDEEMFVLDPTSLTIQNLRLTVEISEADPLSFTQSSLYAVPPSLIEEGRKERLEVTELQPVPFYRATVRGVQACIRASNNPWVGEGDVSIQQATLELAAPANGHENSVLQPVLIVPPMNLSVGVTQTSTTGRLLGSWGRGNNSLDESCFDWRAHGALGPFSFSLKPPSERDATFKDENTSSEVVWRAYRPLAHLLKPFPGFFSSWSRGIFSPKVGSEDGSAPVTMTPEHAMRLGDHYSTFPWFRNSLRMVSASTTTPCPKDGEEASLSTTAPLASQRTGLTMHTLSRQLSLDIKFAPSRSSLVQGVRGFTPQREDYTDAAAASLPTDSIWGIFGGGGNDDSGATIAHKEKGDNRVRALERLHAVQMDMERRRFKEREAQLMQELAALKEEKAFEA